MEYITDRAIRFQSTHWRAKDSSITVVGNQCLILAHYNDVTVILLDDEVRQRIVTALDPTPGASSKTVLIEDLVIWYNRYDDPDLEGVMLSIGLVVVFVEKIHVPGIVARLTKT